MREILFRGKRVDNGMWVFGFYIENELFDGGLEPSIIPVDEKGAALYDDDGYNIEIKVNPKTVGQYTGLADKNGRKVFEHDIIKAYDPLNETSFIGVVKFCEGSFYICDTDFCSYYRWMDYEAEVVGNIFDNPELLGGG